MPQHLFLVSETWPMKVMAHSEGRWFEETELGVCVCVDRRRKLSDSKWLKMSINWVAIRTFDDSWIDPQGSQTCSLTCDSNLVALVHPWIVATCIESWTVGSSKWTQDASHLESVAASLQSTVGRATLICFHLLKVSGKQCRSQQVCLLLLSLLLHHSFKQRWKWGMF